jgi:AcrR family transcriptional regulator
MMPAVPPKTKTKAKKRRPYTPRKSAADRREQLLDAALEVIARDGYKAVSIEAIARQADVTRPVVYNVFDDLEALLFALLDRQERRALNQLLATIQLRSEIEDFDGFVDRAIRDLVAMVAADPMTWRPIFLAYEGTPAAVRARIDRDREIVRRRIQSLAEQALGGLAAPAIDPGVVSHALVAIGEYYGRQIIESPEAVDAKLLAGTVSGLLAAVQR